MPEKRFKQVCECEKCGNEAEMMITCHIEHEDEKPAPKASEDDKKKVQGHAVCSSCGNEADMWIDL